LLEENNIKQADLVGKVGSKRVISEIVRGQRSISESQVKVLGEIFNLSPGIFI
jgi:HTH-type transcriptional regulator/antitoxin HigA